MRFRQNARLPSLEVEVFTATGLVDFPTLFPGGLTYRMVGAGVVITGPATGDANGRLIYNWAAGDLAAAGTYAAYFVGIDASGRVATFPTGYNLEVIVEPTI